MGFFDYFSIKRKLNLITMLTSSVALILACTVFLAYDRYTYKQSVHRELETLADVVVASTGSALASATPGDALATLKTQSNVLSAAVISPDGHILASYHRDDEEVSIPEPDLEQLFQLDDHSITLFHPVILDDEQIGVVFLEADLAKQQQRENRFVAIVIVILGGSFIIVYGVASGVQRIISGPILQLTGVARRISHNRDYSVRAVKTTEDEVGILIDGFNDMLTDIQERDAALQQAKDELEQRVEERTRDLIEANEQLRREVAERQRTESVLREREEQLRQAQKMEAIGRLAGEVAHDFNNHLAIIQGYMDMALDDVSKDFRIHQYLTQARKAIDKSTALIDQLLMFSSKQPMDKRSLEMNHHVIDLQKMMSRLLGEDIEVTLDLQEDLWGVKADTANIDQVISNLFVNARDAMPSGGVLSIKTRKVEIDEAFCLQWPEARKGNFIQLSIGDTGVGMTEDVRAQVFEPFFSTKGPGKGTGLGLSVVYGIVQAHDGWIRVESELNEGSTFSIYLPAVDILVDDDEPQPQRLPLDQLRGNGERVLLVEDEPDLMEMTRRALVGQGYKVEACGTIAEANTAFGHSESEGFDVILSDVVLPDGRGPDLVIGLVEKQPDLAAVLVTGYTDERGDWARPREAGVELLKKPVPMAVLFEQLRDALERRPAAM